MSDEKDAWCDKCDRYYARNSEHDCRDVTPYERLANNLGPLPPMPAVERRLVGLAHHPTIWEIAGPIVATLPTGERIELPAGTVLREGTGAIDHSHLLACARGVVDHDAAQALTGPVAHALLSALRAACGDSTEDVAVRAGPTCSRNEDEPRTLGEQLHDEHNRTAHADGSRCTCDPASAVLTERVGLPREPPRCTGKRPANAGTTGIECDEYACNVHGRGAIRRLREMAPSVQPANADRVGPDPIAALALAAYNATRAGLDRAIADHAKPRT